jgi:hypothetical protein
LRRHRYSWPIRWPYQEEFDDGQTGAEFAKPASEALHGTEEEGLFLARSSKIAITEGVDAQEQTVNCGSRSSGRAQSAPAAHYTRGGMACHKKHTMRCYTHPAHHTHPRMEDVEPSSNPVRCRCRLPYRHPVWCTSGAQLRNSNGSPKPRLQAPGVVFLLLAFCFLYWHWHFVVPQVLSVGPGS